MSERHWRLCWDCQAISQHTDNIKPEVLCKKCKSQDTRRLSLHPCPFCGAEADLIRSMVGSKEFWTVGCNTKGCLAFIYSQSVGYDDCRELVNKWNKRPERK